VREEQKAGLAALRAALIEGEKSGPSTPFDFDDFIARKRETELPTPHIPPSSPRNGFAVIARGAALCAASRRMAAGACGPSFEARRFAASTSG
jgi:hypothetical protein